MTEIIETHGRYRLCLEIDQDSGFANPRDNVNLTHVITPTQSGHFIDIDKNGGPLQYGWDYYSTRALDCVREDAVDLFIRWARIYHGATVVERRPRDGAWGLWYVMPDKAAETTVTPAKIIEADAAEYEAWATGEVYGYVIEQSVEWGRRDGEEGSMTTWDHVDSCWGYIGHQYAEESAREAFAPYKED